MQQRRRFGRDSHGPGEGRPARPGTRSRRRKAPASSLRSEATPCLKHRPTALCNSGANDSPLVVQRHYSTMGGFLNRWARHFFCRRKRPAAVSAGRAMNCFGCGVEGRLSGALAASGREESALRSTASVTGSRRKSGSTRCPEIRLTRTSWSMTRSGQPEPKCRRGHSHHACSSTSISIRAMSRLL